MKTKERTMYRYHKDHSNGKWNVFFEKDGQSEFFCTCETLADAQELCNSINGIVRSS